MAMVSYRSENIKAALDIDRVVSFYGYEPNRQGFVSCPFHSERTASCKVYPKSNSFYCFGCGAGGDVIDFVRLLYGLDFRQACVRLEADFGLVGVTDSASPEFIEAIKEKPHIENRLRELEEKWK